MLEKKQPWFVKGLEFSILNVAITLKFWGSFLSKEGKNALQEVRDLGLSPNEEEEGGKFAEKGKVAEEC